MPGSASYPDGVWDGWGDMAMVNRGVRLRRLGGLGLYVGSMSVFELYRRVVGCLLLLACCVVWVSSFYLPFLSVVVVPSSQ